MRLHLLHGFLGVREDWRDFTSAFCAESGVVCVAHDLWRECPPSDFPSLTQAAARLAQSIEDESYFLIGYSLGGRIALHWPEEYWAKLKGLILVSTNWGQSTEEEKQLRKKNDQQWAESFLHEEWSSILQKWNQQPVFQFDENRPERREGDFSREQLSAALIHWSLATQKNFLQADQVFPFPILSLCGSLDQKFVTQNLQISQQYLGAVDCRELRGGHSLHMQNPASLAKSTKDFIITTCQK